LAAKLLVRWGNPELAGRAEQRAAARMCSVLNSLSH